MTPTDSPPERDAAEPVPAEPIPAPSEPNDRVAAWLEWLTRRRAIQTAEVESNMSVAVASALRRGRKALLAAERWLDPPDGSPRERELGLTMLRESAYWLVSAGASRAVAEGSLDERLAVMAEADPPRLGAWVTANAPPAALGESRAAFAARSSEEQQSGAEAAQRWARALLATVESRYAVLTSLRRQRVLRLGAALLPLSALLIVAALVGVGLWRGPDLAAGKPWRTSSTGDVCYPAKATCGGATTYIFFTTREENNPWYEVDLLSPKRVRSVEIVNRRDTGQERALPMLIEVSLDGERYFQVARRTDLFSEWDAVFEAVTARYVRVSVARQSTLHLERVSVR